jgi:spore coat polysaccharide biosynthesis predicted glycosyltransferase SpsG
MDVKRGPILFRCDGTPELGYEPFYQCLSFAAALQRRRRGTHFLSYLEPLSLAHVINRGNNEWVPAEVPLGDPADVSATVREIRRLNAAAVVVAGAGATEDYYRELRQTGAMVIALDPDAGTRLPADLVLGPTLTQPKKAYRFDPGAQLLVGRKFALVRGVFRRQRTIRATEQPAPFRALVAFGDDDHADQSLTRAKQLLAIDRVEKVSLVTRYHHPRYDDLKDFAADSGGRAEVVTEPKELMTRLVRGHFALTGGDTWSMEMCCVGVPQLLIPATPRHRANAKRMDDEGMATLLGDADKLSVAELEEAVKILLDDPMERLTMSRCARNRIDGRGGDRVVNGMEIMLHAPSRAVPAAAVAA